MQAQRNLTNLCFHIFGVLKMTFAQFVALVSALLLVVDQMIALASRVVSLAALTVSAARPGMEGPPDIIPDLVVMTPFTVASLI
jgi:hypothetical protein